ncbi:MAG: XisI protein [Hormoscilla sp. GM102CHS1]|nr:XisI protein [Hormoscilla sp. GM102CHS1]
MDSLEQDREIIERIISEYAGIPYAHGNTERHSVFDRERDRYLLMIVGWEGVRQVHGCIIHVEMIEGKFWIHRDGTEDGIAWELLQVGIPRERIVLAFKSPRERKLTGFAVGAC